MQLALIGALMVGFATTVRMMPRRASAAAGCAGLVFLFLSLDEIARLHEAFASYLDTVIGNRRATALTMTGPWMLFAAPLLLAALALVAYAGRDLVRRRRKVQALYAAGLTVYVAAFAGLEVVQNFRPGKFAGLVTEELGEMVGGTLLLWATYELLRSHGIRPFAPEAASDQSTGLYRPAQPPFLTLLIPRL